MIYGYARVSSRCQQKDGNSLDDQCERLKDAGAIKIVSECFTGTKVERPIFSELMRRLQPGDTLVVCKLDRFARTATDGARAIQELVGRGIRVNVLNMGIADNTPMGKLMIQIMFAFAEYERDMIMERTQAGKIIAKQKPGYREGRPPKTIPQDDFRQCANEVSAKRITVNQAADILGISRTKWYSRIRSGYGDQTSTTES